jgi:hypothetical protein
MEEKPFAFTRLRQRGESSTLLPVVVCQIVVFVYVAVSREGLTTFFPEAWLEVSVHSGPVYSKLRI